MMTKKESSWRGVVNLPKADLLLKYIPEAVPTINSYDKMCLKDAQEYCFLFAHKDDLVNTNYKYTIQGQKWCW